jgi:hypothetical protein
LRRRSNGGPDHPAFVIAMSEHAIGFRIERYETCARGLLIKLFFWHLHKKKLDWLIPVGIPLKVALEASKTSGRTSTSILTNTKGKPWTEDGFRSSWGKAFEKAGLVDDLRFQILEAQR